MIKPINILIVEDNPLNAKVTTYLLKRMKYQSQIAKSGEIALKLLSQEDFDLVLMDLEMPDLNGFDTSKIIRNNGFNIKNPDIPIIIMTAYELSDINDKFNGIKIDEYIIKPIEFDILYIAINKVLFNNIITDFDESTIVNDLNEPFYFSIINNPKDENLLKKYYKIFYEEALDYIIKFRNILEKNNLDEIKLLTHTLKTSTKYIKAKKCRLLTIQLENAAKENNFEEVKVVYELLEKELIYISNIINEEIISEN